jgi:HD-GYP domain-containing protein (c-di-GMP phosphodiesterase class II)
MLGSVEATAFTTDEIAGQAAWTLDLLVDALRAKDIAPLVGKWEAVGAACATRDLPLEEVPDTPDLLKRAIWRRMSVEVEAGNVPLSGLIDSMMEVETALAACRYGTARSFLEARDVALVARNERIEALYSLTEVLSDEGEGQDTYRNIAGKIASITEFPRSSILLADEEGVLLPTASNDADALDMLRTGGAEPLSALAGALAQDPRPMVLEKGGVTEAIGRLLDAYRTPAVLAVPMLSGDRFLGVVLLDTGREGDFTSKQIDMAVACASQAALAIEKSSLISEMENRLKQMAAIGIVARSLTSHLDPKEQLDSLLQMAITLMRADSGVFMLAEEMFGQLKRDASTGEARWAKGEAFEALARWVFDNSTLVQWHREEPDERFADLELPVVACLTAPLMVRDKAIGVISIGSSKVGERYSSDDIEMFGNFAAQAAVALENTQLYERLQDTYLGAIGSLAAAIEARDPYTVGHSARVTQYAVAIAEAMELPSESVEELRLAGLLHDLGKIGVPDSILNKAGRLSEEEYSAIKMHPALSMRIIEPLPHLGNIIPIIYHHHERYDGNGYMDGKAGEKIPLGARIISVADSYEAMTSDRPYRKALSREEAMTELSRNAGSQFDPEVVRHFLALLESSTPT